MTIWQASYATVAAKDTNMIPFVPTILDQGSEGACVPSATVANLNIIENRMHKLFDYSVLGLYHDTLVAEGRVGQQGVAPTDLFNILRDQGVGLATNWPYNLDHVNDNPTPAYYQNMSKISGYSMLQINPDDSSVLRNQIDLALAEGRPVLVSFQAQAWLRSMSGPLADQQASLVGHYDTTPIGGHEVLIVGRDSHVNGGSYIFQNSWGTGWGDGGFGEMATTWASQFQTAVVFDGFKGDDLTYTLGKTHVAELYAALMNRCVDHGGMQYWAQQLQTQSVETVAQTIVAITAYGAMSNNDFVDNLYVNALGRHADSSGLAYWTTELNSGYNKGTVLTQIITAVGGYTGTDTSAIYSHNLFENKVSIGQYFPVMVASDNITAATHAMSLITDNIASIEVAKIGIPHDLGWA